MSVVLGSPTPGRFAPPTVGASFPKLPATYSNELGTIVVPGGALDRWFAYRKTKGAVRGEIVVFGDSTTYGSGGLYSWLSRVRKNLVAAGMADGGKGIFGAGEDGMLYDTGEVNGFVSSTTVGIGDTFDTLGGQFYYDNGATPGGQLQFQFKGSCARLHFIRRTSAGDLTYSLDGGGAVTVHGHAFDTVDQGAKFVYLSGLDPAALHTITITNRGGRDANPPSFITAGASTSFGLPNALAAATYYYKASYVFGSGETLPCSAGSAIVDSNGRIVSLVVPKDGESSVKIFRSTSPTGPFVQRNVISDGSTGTATLWVDNSTATDGTANPLTVATATLNTSSPGMYVAFAPLYATGVVVQKYATSGATMSNFNGGGGWKSWAALGLTDPTGDRSLTSSYTVDATQPAGGTINPVLAILDLGFNDLSTSAATSTYTTGVSNFAAMCQVAGCDGIVVSGQLPYNANWPTIGATAYTALRDTALAKGLAFVDSLVPVSGPALSYSGGTANPHLTKTQYEAQGDYSCDNVLLVK